MLAGAMRHGPDGFRSLASRGPMSRLGLARSVAAALLAGSVAAFAAGAVLAQSGDEPTPNGLLTLRATVDPQRPGDAATVEFIGRSFTIGPQNALGMGGMPIGNTTISLVDVEPDLLMLTDISCVHRDGDPFEYEVDLDALTFRVAFDADDAIDCTYAFDAPTYRVDLGVESDPPGLEGQVAFAIDGHDDLVHLPIGATTQAELRVLPDGEVSTIVLVDTDGRVFDTSACVATQGDDGDITTAGRSVELGLATEDHAVCTFTLSPTPNGLLTLRATVDPQRPGDAATVEFIGRSFTIGPQNALGMGGMPIGNTTISLVDVEPDLLMLTDISCVHRDGDPFEYEVDLDALTFRVAFDADDAIDCTYAFTRPPESEVPPPAPAVDTGRATVTIVTDPPAPDTAFDLLLAGDPVQVVAGQPLPLQGAAGTDLQVSLVDRGAGYELTGIDCRLLELGDEAEFRADAASGDLELTFHAQDTLACEFSLRQRTATVIARMITEPPSVEGQVDLEMDGVIVSLGHGEIATDSRAMPGDYHIVVPPDPDFDLVGIECADAEGQPRKYRPGDGVDAATLTLEEGSTTSCAFEFVPRVATVIVRVLTEPAFSEIKLDVEMAGESVSLGHEELATDASADAERYAIVPMLASDVVLLSTDCRDDTGAPRKVTQEEGSGAFLLETGVGTITTCTFTVAPNVGTVIATVDAGDEPLESELTLEMDGVPVALFAGDSVTDDDARADLYRLALIPMAGYRLLDIVCEDATGDRMPADITFENQSIAFAPGVGAVVACTFVLEREIARVVATVLVDGDPVETPFTLEMNGQPVELLAGDTATDDEARADLYRIALIPTPGYLLLDIACLGPTGERLPAEVTFENQSIAFAPGIGNAVTCTFTLDEQRAEVVATIVVDRDDIETPFTVEMNGEPVEMLPFDLATDDDARADLYRMALIPDRDFRLLDIVCLDPTDDRLAAEITFENQSIAFAPGDGNRVTCTFTLQALMAEVLVTIEPMPDDITREFVIEMGGREVLLAPFEEETDEQASSDLYRIVLREEPGFRLHDIVCLDPEGERRNANLDFGDQSIEFAPGIGNRITCTVVVEALDDRSIGNDPGPDPEAAPAPRPGPWRGVNHAGSIRCGGITTLLPRSTDNGRLMLRRGGDRIILTGIADGRRSRLVLDRDADRPRVWTGSLRSRSQGIGIVITYEVTMINETRMSGTMRAPFSAAGRQCNLMRDFTLTRR